MGVLCFACGVIFPTNVECNIHQCPYQPVDESLPSPDPAPPRVPPIPAAHTQAWIHTNSDTRNDRGAASTTYSCPHCQRIFASRRTQTQHRKACEGPKKSVACGKCRKPFSNYSSRLRHERTCAGGSSSSSSICKPVAVASFSCRDCPSRFDSAVALAHHRSCCVYANATAGPSGTASSSSTSCTREGQYIKKRKRGVECLSPSKKQKTDQVLRCRICQSDGFLDWSSLYDHRVHVHHQGGGNPDTWQPRPWLGRLERDPWLNDDGSVDENLRHVYSRHRHIILRERKTQGTVATMYNFPITNDFTLEELSEQLEEIYADSQNAFKVNLSFGLILRNIETGAHRFFIPYYNESALPVPVLISNRSDLEKLKEKLKLLSVIDLILKQRPNTKYRPILITNVVYRIYRTSFPLGSVEQPLPAYITNHNNIIAFEKNQYSGKVYDDDLCFFRCLAYHRIKSYRVERLAKELYTKWILFVEKEHLKTTEVTLSNMPDLERCFEINVNVYSLAEKDKSVRVLYKSRQVFEANIMNLNLYENHLSYITKFKSYARKFQCSLCLKLFDRKCHFDRHSKTCEKISKLKFSGGYYKLPRSIYDKLQEFNIRVDESIQHYPYIVCFDLESMLSEPARDTSESTATTWTHLHQPVSVCMCSNVDDFKNEKFVLEEDLDDLLTKMIEYLGQISKKCEQLSKVRWASVYRQLDQLESEWRFDEEEVDVSDVESDGGGDNYGVDDADDGQGGAMETGEYEPPSEEFLHAIGRENVFRRFLRTIDETGDIPVTVEYNEWDDNDDDDVVSDVTASTNGDRSGASSPAPSSQSDVDEDVQPTHQLRNRRIIEDSDDDNVVTADVRTFMTKQIKKLRLDFDRYCKQVPVIGFNSGKYDIGLIKIRLAYHLGLHEGGSKFVVKKNNNYVCLSTEQFKFLDMMNYLPPGVSYDDFLATFNVPVRKSFFPYEYFDSFDRLNETSLPPKEAFYSTLKQCNVLEGRDRVSFCKLTEVDGKTEAEALKILGLGTVPASAVDLRYAELEAIWRDRNMSTFRDWLEYYSKLDVGPFVLAIEAYKEYFLKQRIDVFKDNISVPGIARRLLYESGIEQGGSFSLIDKSDEDLYHTFKANLIGGPSIVYCRHHSVGETFVRSDETRPCRSIVGYDANSLYLHAVGQDMPVGRYIRRVEFRGFKPDTYAKWYYAMFDWMDWLRESEGLDIRHKMNSGREFRVGPYYVDGRDGSNKLYEFLGDYWHGCPCKQGRVDDEKLRETRHRQTLDRLTFIRDRGFEVRVIWECEYRRLLKSDPEMKRFVTDRLPPFCRKYPSEVTAERIVESVLDDTLFGMVEVDIEVPDDWDEVDHKPDTDLSPYEYFREMSPIFCTSQIPFHKIGDLMQEHVMEHNLSEESRTLLVGAMAGEKLLLLTPLLKWYVLHGMLVTKVHQVVEYSKMRCFREFGDRITTARREGDANPDKKVFATLSKLLGNSAFGGTILNKEKFHKVKYLSGFRNACAAVNNPRFRSLNELFDDYFEAEFANSRITMDTPIQLGYSILQYAKLHMLAFYYDFVVKYVDRADFEFLEMDTDSNYFALSAPTLADVVRPSMRQRFDDSLMSHCSDDYRPEVGADDVWLPRQCCAKHEIFDSRCLGLMKLEFTSGTEMISLCSKSYVAKSDITGEVKYSCKGINKRFVDPSDYFRRVMEDKRSLTAVNRGIRAHDNCMMTYEQSKCAFSYFYCKRRVCDDGIHTEPLDIVVTPIARNKGDESAAQSRGRPEDFDVFVESPGRPEEYGLFVESPGSPGDYAPAFVESPGRPEEYGVFVESPGRPEEYGLFVESPGSPGDYAPAFVESPGRPEEYGVFVESPGLPEEYGLFVESPGSPGDYAPAFVESPGRPEEYGVFVESPGSPGDYASDYVARPEDFDAFVESPGRPEDYI